MRFFLLLIMVISSALTSSFAQMREMSGNKMEQKIMDKNHKSSDPTPQKKHSNKKEGNEKSNRQNNSEPQVDTEEESGDAGATMESSGINASMVQLGDVPRYRKAHTTPSARGNVLFYASVVRRFIWFEGVGKPITQAEARRLPVYYRLSMRNDAGHFQLVEAMHGDSLTTEHGIKSYLVGGDGLTSLRTEHQKQGIGKWRLSTDATGVLVVEERAYEARMNDANLVYVMQVEHCDSIHATVTYLDTLGQPMEVLDENDNAIGSVSRITFDEQGHDAIIDYLDGKGYRKPIDGVYQIRRTWDENIKTMSTIAVNKSINDCVTDVGQGVK